MLKSYLYLLALFAVIGASGVFIPPLISAKSHELFALGCVLMAAVPVSIWLLVIGFLKAVPPAVSTKKEEEK